MFSLRFFSVYHPDLVPSVWVGSPWNPQLVFIGPINLNSRSCQPLRHLSSNTWVVSLLTCHWRLRGLWISMTTAVWGARGWRGKDDDPVDWGTISRKPKWLNKEILPLFWMCVSTWCCAWARFRSRSDPNIFLFTCAWFLVCFKARGPLKESRDHLQLQDGQ